jgi:hypothetical protein
MSKYINLTPHAISLNDGRSFAPSGTVARVAAGFSPVVDDIARQTFGEVTGLPEPEEGVRLIVSALVLSALAGSRPDVVAPATGHPDVVRNDKGQVASVPCFVQ